MRLGVKRAWRDSESLQIVSSEGHEFQQSEIETIPSEERPSGAVLRSDLQESTSCVAGTWGGRRRVAL